MNAAELRALQAPLKEQFRQDPAAARETLHAAVDVEQGAVAARVTTGLGRVTAGLHPKTGGDGGLACSGDMLLEALAACAWVTLAAVATAMGITLRAATVRAEGDLDFRGTLGVARGAPVGFAAIRLEIAVDSDATPEQVGKLVQTTERYCVVAQTLRAAPTLTVTFRAGD